MFQSIFIFYIYYLLYLVCSVVYVLFWKTVISLYTQQSGCKINTLFPIITKKTFFYCVGRFNKQTQFGYVTLVFQIYLCNFVGQ